MQPPWDRHSVLHRVTHNPGTVSRHAHEGVLVTCHPQKQNCDQGTDYPPPEGSCCSHGHCPWQGRTENGEVQVIMEPLPASFPTLFPGAERDQEEGGQRDQSQMWGHLSLAAPLS